MHLEILDKNRIEILPKLKIFKDRFYLAGGTALALYIGHRQSIDFDFFINADFDEEKLRVEVEEIFKDDNLKIVQLEKNTLTLILNEDIKISFFGYKYEMLEPLKEEEHFKMASMRDITCMKMSAVCGRSTNKDYIDIFFLLNIFSLKDILKASSVKFPSLDTSVILKSLVYFNEIEMDPIMMMAGFEKDFEVIKKKIMEEVKNCV